MAAMKDVHVLLQQYKINNEWNADLDSLNSFYLTMLQDNEHLSLDRRASIMQQLCDQIDEPVENLQDCLLEYCRVCENCNALHAPHYYTYNDLFCQKCGNSLCKPSVEELDLYMGDEMNEDAEFKTFVNELVCAYCTYKSAE
ncbi:hypothetical protein [Epiphyas postvittana nucleopolyhedrovirus]|uniref:Uncharacterized protein n=1 Tax=Epiphyas postvittana nucleopolyhedrovirus TaxID=70600 RepID=Q91GF6_NPVEP|nr:hypothetical protein [Epiphyas postvittana nucleopolyhedrovirus]AAK85662.1 unknown [Epiphyas postvittana nucleopolyhedrovirus]